MKKLKIKIEIYNFSAYTKRCYFDILKKNFAIWSNETKCGIIYTITVNDVVQKTGISCRTRIRQRKNLIMISIFQAMKNHRVAKRVVKKASLKNQSVSFEMAFTFYNPLISEYYCKRSEYLQIYNRQSVFIHIICISGN